VPIPTDGEGRVQAVTDAPVFPYGKEQLFSGELRCTLTAWTPLLAANEQYDVQDVVGAKKHGNDVELPDSWKIPVFVKEGKKVLEPLRARDGRVLISGSALKGMLRQSLGALLGAPMERVGERSYSYRPNLAFAKKKVQKYDSCPAVVVSGNQNTPKIRVKLLRNNPNAVSFIKDSVHHKFGSPKPGQEIQWKRQPHICCSYKPGVDGDGRLAGVFNEKDGEPRQKGIYNWVFVNKKAFEKGQEVDVPTPVLQHYERTCGHLSDTQHGHLTKDHPLHKDFAEEFDNVSKCVEKNSRCVFEPNTLVYVELTSGKAQRITSFGHHFRYRWRFADTIRVCKSSGPLRSILSPLPEETVKENASNGTPPSQLSGPRLLCGYVSGEGDHNPGTKNIGKGDFSRLAGRLAFNMAVEQADNPADDTRFINSNKDSVVPLKVLGMPRPSAVEFYLDQSKIGKRNDGGSLITYGDLPGDDPPGELNGRKFYLHQPLASTDSSLYEEADTETIKGDQASLARFISKPGTRFRFTLRFRDLRQWELGAVLLILNPENVEQIAEQWPRVNDYLENVKSKAGDDPLFALKLGHGRPLGLGSVTISVDSIQELDVRTGKLETSDKETVTQNSLWALKKKLKDYGNVSISDTLLQWLKVQQYRGRTSAEYPRPNRGTEIFEFHTQLRRDHAQGRRSQPPPVRAHPQDILQPLP